MAGSDADGFFGPFRDALINDPALLAAYNELKLRRDGRDYGSYTECLGRRHMCDGDRGLRFVGPISRSRIRWLLPLQF